MRVKPIAFIVLGALLALALAFAVVERDSLTHAPWDLARDFRFPNGAAIDSTGAFWITDSGGRRLTRVNSAGQILLRKEGGSRSGGFYSATILGPAGEEGVWILNAITSRNSGGTDKEELLLVSPDGSISEPRWTFTPESTTSTEIDYGRFPYFVTLSGSQLFWFVSDGSGNTKLHSVDTATGKDELIRSFNATDAYDFVSASYDPARKTGWFLDNNANILEWKLGSAAPHVIFGNPEVQGRRVRVPTDIRGLPDGSLVLLDGKGELVRIAKDGSVTRPITKASFKHELHMSNIVIGDGGLLTMADETVGGAFAWDPLNPATFMSVSGASLSRDSAIMGWLAWISVGIAVCASLTLLVLLYNVVMKRRTPLILKQFGIFVPLIVCSVIAVSYWVYQDLMARYTKEVETRLMAWSQLAAGMTDAKDIEELRMGERTQGEVSGSEGFDRLTKILAKAVGNNADRWNANIYDYIYVPTGSGWYVFDQFGYYERYLPKPGMLRVANSGTPMVDRYEDAYSQWISGFYPIRRADGGVAAVMEVTIDANILKEVSDQFQAGLVRNVAISVLLILLVSFLSTWIMLRSIHSLRKGAIEIGHGNYDIRVDIKSRDEIEDLGRVFNNMSSDIKAFVDRVFSLNKANARFVPMQFLTFLKKDSIVDINLGDHVERDMTVLFSDIRSFTTISERMMPKENFEFINRYLSEMGPVIRNHEGFIDKYIGDAIMALFPDSAEQGLRAALGMLGRLDRFNATLGAELHTATDDIEIGVGLHTGRLMLGIIGEAERCDGTVISDAVNLASRLESLTKYYGAAILVSGQLLRRVPTRDFFKSRFLDFVRVKGKNEAITIHEILVPGHASGQDKIAAKDRFEKALGCYYRGEFGTARARFEGLAEECPEDNAIPIFLRRMKDRSDHPEGWDGITVLDSK